MVLKHNRIRFQGCQEAIRARLKEMLLVVFSIVVGYVCYLTLPWSALFGMKGVD